jgi:succinate dehydrogenase flavin-adding protein (antitoxin of CptAB toxin-antitoxin module)
MRELDLMLSAWLETGFDRSSPRQRTEFEQLLELSDPELEAYLVWGACPEHPEQAALVQAIRGLRPEDYVQRHANLSKGQTV